MAVVGYPVTSRRAVALPRGGVAGERARHLRLVTGPEHVAGGSAARRRSARTRIARVVPVLLTVGVLAGVWAGASALRSVGTVPLVRPTGAWRVPGGYALVVRPGQSVWSIASSMEPGGDPRSLVDEIDAELPGGVLVAGTVLRVP